MFDNEMTREQAAEFFSGLIPRFNIGATQILRMDGYELDELLRFAHLEKATTTGHNIGWGRFQEAARMLSNPAVRRVQNRPGEGVTGRWPECSVGPAGAYPVTRRVALFLG